VLQRALAKTPADRFNPVAQFAAALGGTVAGRLGDAGGGTPVAVRSGRNILPWAIALVATLGLIWLGWRARGAAAGSASSDPPRSVAVLPFENLSGDSASEHFSQGVAEEILHALAQIPDTVPWEFSADKRMGWLGLLGDTLGVLQALDRGPRRGIV